MRDELLAYLLNDLDDEQRLRIEARLESDPIWRHELERLRSYVEEAYTTEAAEEDAPPEDLVHRTCSFVKQASAQGALSPAVLPASLTESQEVAAPRNRRFSLLDFAAVACIFLVLGSLLFPALRKSRDAARRQQCQENLHRLGIALAQFAEHSGGQLPAIERHENAGMYALKLFESGFLASENLLVCPSTTLAEDISRGVVVMHFPTRRELAAATGAELRSLLEHMGGSFAYRIGYIDQNGIYRQAKFSGRSNVPIMSDKPNPDYYGYQSYHHGICGQNVLFQDLSVRYIRVCIQTDRDKHWFLNEDKQPAAGKHKYDIVMMPSEATPSGSFVVMKKSVFGK